MAQLVALEVFVTDTSGTIHPYPQNGPAGLDTLFPYFNFQPNADGTNQDIGDTPFITLDSNNMSKADDSNVFQTYVLYQPPSAGSGVGVTWVPLKRTDWNWHGIAEFNTVTNTWGLDAASNGVNITSDAPTTTLPTWTVVRTGQ